MKKIVIVLACCLIAGSALAEEKRDGGSVAILGGLLDCSDALQMTCGDVATGALPVGQAGNVSSYGCTTLSYAGSPEAVYEVCIAADGNLQVDMTYTHTTGANDLDLFLLGSCNEADCLDASLGVSGSESVSAAVTAGTYYVVVDGWNGASNGSPHVVSVICDAPCGPVSVEPGSWGSVKSLYK